MKLILLFGLSVFIYYILYLFFHLNFQTFALFKLKENWLDQFGKKLESPNCQSTSAPYVICDEQQQARRSINFLLLFCCELAAWIRNELVIKTCSFAKSDKLHCPDKV
jgi:hypothetical protein